MMNTVTLRVGGLVGGAIYLAFGMLYHLVASDVSFVWTDPWLYVHMGLWPFFILGWLLAIAAVVCIVALLYLWFDDIAQKRKRRKKRKAFEKERLERRRPNPPPE